MRCAACGSESPDESRFCGRCGAPLGGRCPRCETRLNVGLRFCTGCGLQLGATSGDVTPDAETGTEPTAERRRISVLFVDLEDFTALAETLDPEEVRRVQSRYFEVARSVVAAHDGTLEKFIGDAVMAVWGAPAAHEDDAERAVRAALAVVDQVARLGGAVADRHLAARAAVTSGEAAVTIGASDQGLVAGDLVNVAARLQPLAPSGGVLVDAATRERAPDAAHYEPIGSLALKGRSAPVAAFRAITAGWPAAGQVAGVHGGPFVGRDGEMRELAALYEGVAADRHGRLVSVTGIAGIGKSRLAWELGQWLDARPESVAWHVGRTPAYGEGITFAAVAEMVRRRIRVADDDPPGVALRQLTATLAELMRDEDERRWLAPRVAVLLGRDADHAFERDELFAAWRRFFERVSDRSPVVLVFEDVQWADDALLDFVEHLAAWSRSHRIMVVTLARPELLDRRPGWGSGVSRFTSIHLERLDDESMRALLAAQVPNLPEATTSRILERAGGVPLYAVEVARILGAGAADAEHRADRFDVPDSLAGLISARIDALGPQERRLLLSAAVLGRAFRPEALIAISDADPDAVRGWTDHLVQRELLQLDDEVGSPGRGELAFVQEVLRDVAYRTLALTDRRTLHIAAARYEEAREDEGAAEALANHLLRAYALAPDHADAPRLARRAVGALRSAARDSMRLHAPERALRHLDQALDLVDSKEQRAILLEEAAAAARAAARLDVAETHLRQLVALHGGDDPAAAARARARLASVLLMAQRNEPALAELEAALSAMKDPDADPAGVEVAAQLARARVLMGADASGLEWAERAVAAAERLGMDAVAADALVTRGTARIRLDDEAGGLADLGDAIARSRSGGHVAIELRARNNLAWLAVADDPWTTLRAAREGFELATAMGIGDLAAQLAEVACAAAVDTGDWSWALATIDELERGAIPEANRISLLVTGAIVGALTDRRDRVAALEASLPLPPKTDAQVVSDVERAQAWISFAAGDSQSAMALAGSAAPEALGAARIDLLALRARAALWSGDLGSARESVAVAEAEAPRGRAVAASLRTLRAGITAVDGSRDAAAEYEIAFDEWRALDLPLHLALARLDADRLLGAAAPPRDALVAELGRLDARGLLRLIGAATPS